MCTYIWMPENIDDIPLEGKDFFKNVSVKLPFCDNNSNNYSTLSLVPRGNELFQVMHFHLE